MEQNKSKQDISEENKYPSGSTYYYEGGIFSYSLPVPLDVVALQQVNKITCGRKHFIMMTSLFPLLIWVLN